MKTCFFIGHRETGERILPALAQEIERHVTEYGVTEFVVGHYGGFDRLAASAGAREAKKLSPGDHVDPAPALSSTRPVHSCPRGL